MFRKLGFRHVEVIHAIILTGSVTGAASRLHVTQPAVSNLLRDAQERLGFALFDRRAGRLVPTPSAELLFEEIERSFIGLEEINGLCDRIRNSQRRKLSIACTPGFSAAVLPQIVLSYKTHIEDMFFSVHSRSAEHVAALVSSRKADVGFALDVPPIPGVESEVLAELPMVCYLPPSHALGRRRTITASDLRSEPMISLSRNEGIDDIVANAFRGCGGPPAPVAECPAAIGACAMVAAGMGFTIFDPLVAFLFRRSGVSVRRFEPAIHLVYRAYWFASRTPTFDRQRLIEIAREVVDRQAGQWKRESR